MFTRSVLHVLAPLMVWALAWTALMAQTPAPLVAIFPRDGDVDISTHVTFTAASYKPLDMTTLTLGSVLFIEDVLAQRLDRSQWDRHSTLVQPIPQGSTLFSVTPHGLKHGTRYRCLVKGLSVINSDPSGSVRIEQLPPLEVTFTTVPAVPEYVGWSVDASAQIHCQEPVTLRYSTSLERYQPLPPDLVSVERVDPTAPGGFVPVPIMVQPSTDGRALTVTTRGGWEPGTAMRISSNLHRLTGNPIAHHLEYVRVRSTGTLIVTASDEIGGATSSDVESAVAENAGVIHAGRDVLLSVPPSLGAWQFVRWSTDEINGLDGRTSAQVRIPVACSTLTATMHVTAIYERRDGVDIAIDAVDNGIMELRTPDMVLIKRITTDTTIHVARTAPMVLLAVPAQGYQFSSWNSTMAAVNASTQGTVLLGGALLGPGAAQQPPALNPVFIPTPGGIPVAELYRLRGDIVDEDQEPLHPVENGVAFTTERLHEAAAPGQRVLCVTTTSRNWEITGYAIASTGQVVRFQQPQREACVAAELERPLNVVTFHARRTPLSLRVDRVLLKTDDVASVIRGKDPHHDARVAIDVQEMFRGATTWREHGLVACRDAANDMDFRSTLIKAGDVIRFRTTDAMQRAQAWATYAPVQAYLTPGAGVNEDGWYSTTTMVDRDHGRFATSSCSNDALPANEVRVRACWRQQFGIDAIALRVLVSPNGKRESLRFEEQWLDPLVYQDLLPGEPRGGRQLEYLPGYGTSIKVRFTGPVDILSVLGGAITANSEANTLPNDPLLRGLDFTTATGTTGNTNFEPANGDPITTVELRVVDLTTNPRLQALPFGQVMMTCTRNVHSLDGDPLPVDFSYIVRTVELPAHGLFLQKVGLSYDGDWDLWPLENDGEIYHGLMGGYVQDQKYRGLDEGFHRLPDCTVQSGKAPDECTVEQSDKDAPYNWGDHIALFEPTNMQERDVAHHSIITYDEDCKDENDCLVNRLDDLLESARKAFAKGEAKDLVAFALDFTGALLPPDEQDEYLGSGSVIETIASKWGAAKDGSRTIRLNAQNCWYEYQSRLYPHKQILR